jgi:excisionase family DNA binding protein
MILMSFASIPERDGGEGGWLSVPVAAARLSVVPKTVYRLINNGDLPAYQVSRMIRIRAEDLDCYIESHRIQPGDLAHLFTPHPTPTTDARTPTARRGRDVPPDRRPRDA